LSIVIQVRILTLTPFEVHQALASTRSRLVLVESCTAGLAAGKLGQIPGISEVFCGSFVVYRNASKHDWLAIPTDILDDPAQGPVSSIVTKLLAIAALERTPEATLAAAITGHLGPGAPPELDGVIYCATQQRLSQGEVVVTQHRLTQPAPSDQGDWPSRTARQEEAVTLLYREIVRSLN
jgi:nicotinamide-nucleotide amidase